MFFSGMKPFILSRSMESQGSLSLFYKLVSNISLKDIVVSNLFLNFATDKLAHNGLAGQTYWTTRLVHELDESRVKGVLDVIFYV